VARVAETEKFSVVARMSWRMRPKRHCQAAGKARHIHIQYTLRGPAERGKREGGEGYHFALLYCSHGSRVAIISLLSLLTAARHVAH